MRGSRPTHPYLNLLIISALGQACGGPGLSEAPSSATTARATVILGGPVCPTWAQCFYVRNTAASGPDSLAQAVADANARPGLDRILFDIPGSGPHVIAAGVNVTDSIYLDGYSQPGAARATDTTPAVLEIVLDGVTNAGTGVYLAAGGSVVTGLVIQRFAWGVSIVGDDNIVEGCRVGTDVSGIAASPNGIVGSQVGSGVQVIGARNVIGGDSASNRNLISGNYGAGVSLAACTACVVSGNYVGTDVTGTADLGNDTGVWVGDYNDDVVIGGSSASLRNVISGNFDGIYVSAGGARIEGNYIGTTASGQQALPNINGVFLGSSAANVVVGGTASASRNVISGHTTGSGVKVWGSDNFIQGNFIGVDLTGELPIANGIGVLVHGHRNLIGGATVGAGNVISGNTAEGVSVVPLFGSQSPTGNSVLGNRIGVGASGVAPVGNGGSGVMIHDGVLNLVGGAGVAGNVIGGNASDGVRLEAVSANLASSANAIAGNFIGTNAAGGALGNQRAGVRVIGGTAHWIGGTLAGQGNTIAGNGADGVRVESGTGHAVLRNVLRGNGGLGIDIGPSGVTANDGSGDPDVGANGLQNAPRITALSLAGASVTVSWELRTTASVQHRLEFFASSTCDASGFGEAERYLGAVTVTTDATGAASGQAVFAGASSGEWVTASASAITGPLSRDTSELARCVRVP